MARFLISWIAVNNDFEKNQVSLEGPTIRFHENFFKDYDCHLLLFIPSDNDVGQPKEMLLYSALKREFPKHLVELKPINVSINDVVDFNRIYAELSKLLYSLKNDELDIFVSPGTPTMQVVWHFLHSEMGLKTRLLQTLKPEHSRLKKPELIEIKMTQANYANYLLRQEQVVEFEKDKKNKEKQPDYLITPALKPIYKLAEEIALTNNTTVLIQGETGTGKEHLAREIHNKSKRKNAPFIAVNCAALSPELLESRLFGYEKGAFTSAIKTTSGYFQVADGGTIFLDEIGDINKQTQIALLRIAQLGEFQKVGSTITEKVDVRLIVATNKDLYEECNLGNFRWDLYYRLSVAELMLPSLRQRGEGEIKLLIEFFNQRIHKKLQINRKPIIFTSETMKILLDHTWPGNIRELENLVERCYAFGVEEVQPADVPTSFYRKPHAQSLKLEDVIRHHVEKVVGFCNGNLSKAKGILGLGSINTVKKYLNRGSSG